MSKVGVSKNYAELCEKAVQSLLSLSKEKIEKQNRFTIALAGGSTPKGVYSLMASEAYRKQFNWEKIHFFWGDERWVSSENPRSNYKMVSETLLTKIEIPQPNIHPVKTVGLSLEQSASAYEKELISNFGTENGNAPCFDLILLGLGEDGHVASLFPNAEALCETKRLVVSVCEKTVVEERVTLTLPVINHADNIFFLVSGKSKTSCLKKILEMKGSTATLPAQKVKPHRGNVVWFVDQAAAEGLTLKSEE